MLLGEAGATRVGRVVNENGFGIGLNLRLEVVKVNLPLLLGDQVVVVELYAQILANRLAKRESRSCHQHTVTTVA